jgi:hypothetical protein
MTRFSSDDRSAADQFDKFKIVYSEYFAEYHHSIASAISAKKQLKL